MTSPVRTVTADVTARDAWDRMQAERIHHLVVVDRKGGSKVVGVLSSRDLGEQRGDAVRDRRSVGDLMATTPVTADPMMHLKEAANVMRGRGIGCLPVCARRKLVGVVTVADLLEALGRAAERPVVRGTRWTLHKRGERRPRPRA